MKILIGILVILLAVFLNSVELGTPLGGGFSFRGSAPKPVSVSTPSERKQTKRGGRSGKQKSGSTPEPANPEEASPGASPSATRPAHFIYETQEQTPTGVRTEQSRRSMNKIEKKKSKQKVSTPSSAAAPRAAPEASSSAARPVDSAGQTEKIVPAGVTFEQLRREMIKLEIIRRQQSGSTSRQAASPTESHATPVDETPGMHLHDIRGPQDVYFEDPKFGFIPLHKGARVCRFKSVLIGIMVGEYIEPVFNGSHEIIRIDYNKGGLRTTMSKKEAKRWGVFGKWADLMTKTPPAFL